MTKILLHQCCAPCSIYPLDRLLSEKACVHGFFYNPNIHPYTEYKKRMTTLIEYNNSKNINFTIIDEYGLREFIKMEQTLIDRCAGCYRIRLEKTAEFAKENGFDAFTSTLLYSKMQKHELIRKIAEEIAAKYDILFHYEDYREGWQEAIAKSKEIGMYRQNYCGCIFSEEERFNKALRKKKSE